MFIIHFWQVLTAMFSYTTGDAAGQNMTTSATWAALLWIKDTAPNETGITIREYYSKSNIGGEKQASVLSNVHGRGIHAMAEAHIPEHILKDVLKTNAQKLVEYWNLGSASFKDRAGQITKHANIANIIAAMFIATGQDAASIAESCTGALYIVQRLS